ncbi:MAG: hypothetical protein IPK27_03265 [Rhodanobacteraceae bacterium]|nr:hypothetical protein [Rhodanobacteraceae bacterium]
MDLNSMIELAQFQTDSYHAAVDRAATRLDKRSRPREPRIPDFTPGAGSTPTEPSSEPRADAGEVEALAQRIVSYQ